MGEKGDNNKGDKLLCYNRGCGQTFYPNENIEDSCTFHPGEPFFHDAYKGWTCCNKKCTDFTEFLNFKGCAKSRHNNVKPPEPEKQPVDKLNPDEVIEYRPPIARVAQRMARPSFDMPMVKLEATVSPTLVQQVAALVDGSSKGINESVTIGTNCKNGGCKVTYSDEEFQSRCLHHPGCPIFHEGLKFWSCCQRRTTDFQAFLDQVGCRSGDHVWIKEKPSGQQQVSCRMDWHQTASTVVVSVFAKKYDPARSSLQLSPVRLSVLLYFPEEEGSYMLDIELRGIVDVDRSSAQMLPTKVEVKLIKAEPGSWANLDFPRKPEEPVAQVKIPVEDLLDLDAVDLSDL